MSEHLPPRFAEVERELDRIARRLLAEQLEGGSVDAVKVRQNSAEPSEPDHKPDEAS